MTVSTLPYFLKGATLDLATIIVGTMALADDSAASLEAVFWPVFCSSASGWPVDITLALHGRWRR